MFQRNIIVWVHFAVFSGQVRCFANITSKNRFECNGRDKTGRQWSCPVDLSIKSIESIWLLNVTIAVLLVLTYPVRGEVIVPQSWSKRTCRIHAGASERTLNDGNKIQQQLSNENEFQVQVSLTTMHPMETNAKPNFSGIVSCLSALRGSQQPQHRAISTVVAKYSMKTA